MLKQIIQVSHLLYVYYLITLAYIYFDESGFIKTMEILVCILLIWCHLKTTTTDPGPINVKKTPIELMDELKHSNLALIKKNEEQLKVICHQCNQWKPPKTHHCKTCKKCIHYRDHHCRWLNCCIGFQNLKFFSQFLAYLMLQQCLSCYQVLNFARENLYQCHIKNCFIHFDWMDPLKFIFFACTPVIFRSIIIKLGIKVSYELFVDKLHQIPDLDTYNESKLDKFVYYKIFSEKFLSLFSSNIFKWFLPLRNTMKLNYLELTYPKVTSGSDLLDYHLNEKDENYYFYKQFEIK